jgi:hypothetical protein
MKHSAKVSVTTFLLIASATSEAMPAAPVNDDPCLATALTAGASCTFISSTNQDATATAGVPAPGCASYSTADVWFSITVPASGSLIIDSNTGGITDAGMALYTGTCSSLSLVTCNDDGSTNGAMPMITQGGLTAGSTVFVRMWEYGGDVMGSFSICAQAGAGGGSAPANDDPCSATAITVGATCSYSSYTNSNATASAGVPAPGCANYSGGDVWFSVTVPASGNLIFDTNTGTITDGGMAIYTGTCGALSLVTCNDDGSSNGLMPMISQPGLTPGATVWIRVWEYGNDSNGSFSLCVYDGGSTGGAPANDNPCNATTVAVGTSCTFSTYTNANATATAGVTAPGCASYSGGDVWFQVTVPASGALAFDSNSGVITDGGMAIYSGTCGALTLIACDDDNSANGAMPYLSSTTLTPGATIWIRMWEFGNDNNGTFQLCVYETTAPPPPPGNVTCGGMDPICSDTPITFTASTGGTSASIANPGNNYGCLFTSPNPTWYYLQLQTGGTVSINMSAGSDIDFALWGPFANLTAAQSSCNSYGAPLDCSYSTAATEQANVAGAVAGQVYVLLVTNYADVTQVIDLNSGAGNTALTDCSIILPVELTNLSALVTYAGNTIKWTTASELASDYFVIQRSEDGNLFTEIGTVDANGNSSAQNDYDFLDRDFGSTLVYYRIKMVDLDGTEKLSPIVSANRETDKILIYPNPTEGNIGFDFPSNQTGMYTIRYRNTVGQLFEEIVLLDDHLVSYTSTIFMDLPSGIYFVEITDENGNLISIQKVIKSKI